MNILLAVDGSAYTKRMLAWLTTNDEWLSAPHEFTIVTVTPPISPYAASMFAPDELKSYYSESSEAVFKPIRKFMAKHDLATHYVSKVGHPAEVIGRLVDKEKFDLIIMGSHGHGNFLNLVMGSVASQVLARCKVPVLLVR
ncbi:MAG: universal stress protein [Burkholderiales bacterium]|nr:universal stress protein [Burkholderiales bacterium]